MTKKHLLFTFTLLLVVMLLAVSCAPPRRPGEVPPETAPRQTRVWPQQQQQQAPVPAPRTVPAPQRALPAPTPAPGGAQQGTPQAGADMQQRAERIAQAAAAQPEIDSATCLITGNTALVGVQFDDQYRGQLTNRIKERVEERVRESDQRITRVVVTADPDLVTRIETMFRQTGQGRPISGFARELNEMINRIQPR